MRASAAGNFFRRALGYNLPSGGASFRPQIDDPIRFGDDVEVVFYDDDGVPLVYEPLQHGQQAMDVGDVQSDGRLFEQVNMAFSSSSSLRFICERGD